MVNPPILPAPNSVTSAGMHPLVPYLLGQTHPAVPRLTAAGLAALVPIEAVKPNITETINTPTDNFSLSFCMYLFLTN